MPLYLSVRDEVGNGPSAAAGLQANNKLSKAGVSKSNGSIDHGPRPDSARYRASLAQSSFYDVPSCFSCPDADLDFNPSAASSTLKL